MSKTILVALFDGRFFSARFINYGVIRLGSNRDKNNERNKNYIRRV